MYHTRTPVQYYYVGLTMINDFLIKSRTTQTPSEENNQSKVTAQKKPTTNKYFIKGPIPWNWICSAAQCTGKTLQVALAIHFLSGLTRSKTVKLPNKIMLQLGVDRHSKYRAINKLESENLIKVTRKQGQAPTITIITNR